VIDVGQALSKATVGDDLDDNGWEFKAMGFGRSGRRRIGVSAVVRDVSWHPYEGVLVFTMSPRLLMIGEFILDEFGRREWCCYNTYMGW